MGEHLRLFTLCFAITIGVSGISACNRNQSVEAARGDGVPTVTPAEQDFMLKAAEANLAEIEMARIAAQKTDNTDVREYAILIQREHNAASQDLLVLMKRKNMTMPQTLAAGAAQEVSRMNALAGPESDREFANAMVADHESAVTMFRKEAEIVKDPDVRKYLDDILPKLQVHLEKAQRLQSAVFGVGRPK